MVTSHGDGSAEGYDSARSWAPMNAYLASPAGQETLEAARKTGSTLEPVQVEWNPTTIEVDGQHTAFEVCDLIEGWWAAVGRTPKSIVTIDSRGVPLGAVRLEQVELHPLPPAPDLGARTGEVRAALDARFAKVPFRRVRSQADYWALRDIEADHIRRVAHEHRLSDEEQQELSAHWLGRIDQRLAGVRDCWQSKNHEMMLNSRIAAHLQGHSVLFQLWANTIGPGARCWFSNRYTPIRHHTFRLRWRP